MEVAKMKKSAPREVNELVKLDDEAFVDTHEAAAFLGFSSQSLAWYRANKLYCSPKFHRVGSRSIRYKMADLRDFAKRNPDGFHAPRIWK